MLTATDLTAESIILEAAELTGAPPDVFEFREALERLTGALEAEAELTAATRPPVRAALVKCLVTQARLAQLVTRHPEIASLEITRPVFVTGLLRSGTTLMHNLLGQHPGLRAPALWELMSPAGAGTDQELSDDAQTWVDSYYRIVPELRAVHLMAAGRPDECHRLMATTFESMIYEARYRVPRYAAWLRERDLTAAFQYHRRQLRAILWRRPGHPVVLKCPFHLWSLDVLSRVYPDARIVQLHRTPTETIPSTCSLCLIMRRARAGRADAHEIGRQWLDRIGDGLDNLDRTRRAVPDGRLLDVRYDDLVRDPIATVSRVCDFIGVPMTGAAADAMRRYLAANGKDSLGGHRYRAAQFGLDETDLDRRFAWYREAFQC